VSCLRKREGRKRESRNRRGGGILQARHRAISSRKEWRRSYSQILVEMVEGGIGMLALHVESGRGGEKESVLAENNTDREEAAKVRCQLAE